MKRTTAIVLSQDNIAADIFSMRLGCRVVAEEAKSGQFLSLYCRDASRLLPRPISICDVDRERGILRLVYRRAGAGTEEFSHLLPGDAIDVLGPLGNGYPLRSAAGKCVWLMGGGIGIPPLVYLAKELSAALVPESAGSDGMETESETPESAGQKSGESGRKNKESMAPRSIHVILGYKDVLFLDRDLEAIPGVHVHIATEDGSSGAKGTVFDALPEEEADVIYACGPTPMLRAVRDYALRREILCWLSLEQRMACGVGACLACVCESAETDAHSNVRNKRICAEGPVFEARDIVL